MEETIGERINVNRTAEAVATGADEIAVGCPFCNVMLSDGLTAQQAEGKAGENVKIIDVAQMLLASVKRGQAGNGSGAEEEAADVVAEAEAITAVAAGAGATEAAVAASADEPSADAAEPSDAKPAEPADVAVPAEPIAAEAVEPFSAEAEKAKEDFAKEAPMADDAPDGGAEVPESAAEEVEQETPAEHLMEHNDDLEPTDDEARDEEAAELVHEHEADAGSDTTAEGEEKA
jgi:hypothetical protein